MNKNKCLIFPYTKEEYCLLTEFISKNYEVHVSSFKGSGLINCDASDIVNKKSLNIRIQHIEDALLNNYDVIYVTENILQGLDVKEIKKLIVRFKEICKKIIYLGDSNDLNDDHTIVNISNVSRKTDLLEASIEIDIMSKLEIPIIYVGGIISDVENFYVALKLKKEFEIHGYKVEIISNSKYTSILGGVEYPKTYLNTNSSIEKQIFDLNKMYHLLYQKYKPDLLIIDIPLGIIPISKKITNNFGVHCDILSTALPGDYFITLFPANMFTDHNVNYTRKILEKKFSIKNESYFLSNVYYDQSRFNFSDDITPTYIDIEEIKMTRKKFEKENLFIDDESNFKEIFSNIVCNLS